MKSSDLASTIAQLSGHMFDQQIKWRRHLHRYPEVSNQETKTTAFVADILRDLGLKQRRIKLPTGVLAELHSGRGGKTVALRTDIDALPVTERTGLPFSSEHDGCMHACGHDMHMATLLGTAAILSRLKDRFSGTVRFIFQPAEELPPGGAQPMIENGALDDAAMIFGLHVDPHLATGKISLRDGPTMGSVFDFDLTILGRGGHAARPHLSTDAVVVAAEVIESLQKVVSRETDATSPVVITFGRIEGGGARNVIADRVVLNGTVRTLSPSAFKQVPRLIRRTVGGICKARGAQFEMQALADYPVLVNHASANRILGSQFEQLFGRGKVAATDTTLAGEDFAYYTQKIPGAMFRLGVMNKKIGADKPWHSPDFIVDERAVRYGTSLMVAAAIAVLNGSNR